MRVGLVADTHGMFDPRLEEVFRGCDLVLHAGDVTGPRVLADLSRIAPVHAVRGNNDLGPFGASLPELLRLELGGLSALVIHELWAPGRLSPAARRSLSRAPAKVVLFGHSHRPSAEVVGGVLYVNPGSAGPRRFHLPRSAAVLEVRGRRVAVETTDLGAPLLRPLGERLHADLP